MASRDRQEHFCAGSQELPAFLLPPSKRPHEPDDNLHREFWSATRKLDPKTVYEIVREHEDWPRRLRGSRPGRNAGGLFTPCCCRVRSCPATEAGTMTPPWTSVSMNPTESCCALSERQKGRKLTASCRWSRGSSHTWIHVGVSMAIRMVFLTPPRPDKLKFTSCKGAGSLEILALLSDEGRARYTHALLNLESCYERWMMRHTGTNRQTYREMPFESLTIHMLRKHGRVRASGGVVPLADALGSQPKSADARDVLLAHPKAEKIKAVFDLTEPTPEFFGEDDPIPLIDIWPGLTDHLPPKLRMCGLIRCERILVVGQEQECVFHPPNIYVANLGRDNYLAEQRRDNEFEFDLGDPERGELNLIAERLFLGLTPRQLDEISQRKTPREVEERRAAITRIHDRCRTPPGRGRQR